MKRTTIALLLGLVALAFVLTVPPAQAQNSAGNVFRAVVATWGGIKVGQTGTAIDDSYAASSTQDVAEIAAATCTDSTAITVTGAAENDGCVLGLPSTIEAGLSGSCFVSASNAVKFRLCNVTASPVNPASQTFTVRVVDP